MNKAPELSNCASGPDLDLGALMIRLRSQADRQRRATGGNPVQTPAFNWPQVHACLTQAARLAPAPTAVPPLGRLAGVARWLVRQVLHGFLMLARVVTVRQGEVNGLLIAALRETAEALRDLEKQVARHQERLRQLETVLRLKEAREAAFLDKDVTNNGLPTRAA